MDWLCKFSHTTEERVCHFGSSLPRNHAVTSPARKSNQAQIVFRPEEAVGLVQRRVAQAQLVKSSAFKRRGGEQLAYFCALCMLSSNLSPL